MTKKKKQAYSRGANPPPGPVKSIDYRGFHAPTVLSPPLEKFLNTPLASNEAIVQIGNEQKNSLNAQKNSSNEQKQVQKIKKIHGVPRNMTFST